MCTFVILRRPDHDWPVLIAANRDEMTDRPWKPPARHWADRPDVTGGLDELAGGTWLAVNDSGVVAAVLNREGSLGPTTDKRTRGELVLEAVDHADAADAAEALAGLDGSAYRSFNLMIADNANAYWIRGTERPEVELFDVPPGLHMITARDLDDTGSARLGRFLPLFRSAIEPDPDSGDWLAWERLLSARLHDVDEDPRETMCIVTDKGYGTVSSTLIALPSAEHPDRPPVWRFANGRPDISPFEAVTELEAAE
ncbi:MAG: NRDE family protein [Alphaproteobacteria bacterium]|nr:NRDE family protein [Alphaproteobacteria bacterium]